MSIKYKDVGYARDKLVETLVRYNGQPVIVGNIDGRGKANIYKVFGNHTYIDVKYGDLELEPVSLGNINFNGGVAYASRIPKRRDWRQGLRNNNMHISQVIDGFGRNTIRLTSTELGKTIIGSYPSIETCVESITCGEAKGMAFSRFFSVGSKSPKGYPLYFKHTIVGIVTVGADGRNINTELMPEFGYLNEMLIEEMKIV